MDLFTTQNKINSWAHEFKSGSHQAAERIFNHYYPLMFRFFLSRLRNRDAAQDVAQNVFLKVVKMIATYNPEKGHFNSWVWQIARNTLTDHLRSMKRNQTQTESALAISIDEIANERQEDYSMKYDTEQILKIVKSFHEEDQELFHYRYISELSYSEIAELTGRTENSLRVAMQRIRKKIKNKYD